MMVGHFERTTNLGEYCGQKVMGTQKVFQMEIRDPVHIRKGR